MRRLREWKERCKERVKDELTLRTGVWAMQFMMHPRVERTVRAWAVFRGEQDSEKD